MERTQSGLGIASFVTSIAAGFLIFCLIVVAGAVETATPGGMNPESVTAIVIGLCLFAFMFASLVALGLGIGALFQQGRKKLFAILGTVFAAVTLLGAVFIIILGLAMG